jgi:small subunit ribosomal protein S6
MAQLQSLADAPGTQREYETIFIVAPDTRDEEIASVNQRVRHVIEGMGGKVLKVDNWGKRKLAYEIAKQLKGIYLYWSYLATPGVVDEFERNLRMLDTVIRYFSVKVDADIDPTARPSEVDDEAYVRAATTAADEEELMLGKPVLDDDDDDDGDVIAPGMAGAPVATEEAAPAGDTGSSDEET